MWLWGTGAVVVILIALVDDAEAGEGEAFVDLADEFGAGGDEACEATSCDGAGVWAKLGDHAFEDTIDQPM